MSSRRTKSTTRRRVVKVLVASSCVNTTGSSGSSGSSSSSSKGGGRGLMKLSTDPQSVAARQRRHRISERFKMLQSLIPGGCSNSNKMDTVSMLEKAIHYVKFLKTQLWLHHTIMINNHHEPASDHDDLFLNSIMTFNSSPTTNAHVNNIINSSTTKYIPAVAAAGISGMPQSPPPVVVPITTTFSSVFCYDHQDDIGV